MSKEIENFDLQNTESLVDDSISTDDPIFESQDNENERREGIRFRKHRVKNIIEGDTKDSELSVLTPEEERIVHWQEIKKAEMAQTILERRIVMVEPAVKGRKYPRVIVEYSGFRVAISTRDFFDRNLFSEDMENKGEDERNVREFQMASKMVGAYIPFIITSAISERDSETGRVIYAVRGSRKLALERRKARFYFGSTPIVEVGSRIKARVLMAGHGSVLMDVVGYEAIVPVAELSSCKWIDPVYDFPAGTVTYVDVKSLEVDRENRKIEMEVTRKTLDELDAVRNYEAIQIGAIYSGTVISIGNRDVFINLDCNVKAVTSKIALNGSRLRYGDRVTVVVRHKNDEKMTCSGSCIPVRAKLF